MQSYFATLPGNNGTLGLLDDTNVVDSGERQMDISSSLAQIGLQTSPTGHHALEQANLTLHSHELFDDEEDLFLCGRCKQQFTDLQLFLRHKGEECIGRQQTVQCHNHNLMQMQQQQQPPNHQVQQQHRRPPAIPGPAVLFSQNQDLVSQGQQPHSIMISTSQCPSQRVEDTTGLNLTRSTNKGHDLGSASMRNALGDMNVLACEPDQQQHIGINQVGNLVQLRGAQYHSGQNTILQRGMPSTSQSMSHNENLVLSDDILLDSSQTQTEFNHDSHLGSLQQSEVNSQQFNSLSIGLGGNGSMSSFLQQIPPLHTHQQQNVHDNQQVLIHMPQANVQQNVVHPQKDMLNSTSCSLGILTGVNLAPFSVSSASTSYGIPENQTQSDMAVQNLSKLPTIAPRPVDSMQPDRNATVNQIPPQAGRKEIPGSGTDENKEASSTEKTKKKFACQHCPKAFTRGFDLDQHVRSHTGEKPFQCIVCGRAFSQKSNVKKHMATHKVWPKQVLDDIPNIVIIQAKDKDPKSQDQEKPSSELEEDKGGHGTNSYKEALAMMTRSVHTCPYCFKMLSSSRERKAHMMEHKDKQVYKCVMESCEETFQDLDSYIEHVKLYEADRTFRCHTCHKIFDSLHDLGVHQYQDHLNDKSKPQKYPKVYYCSLCPNKFAHPELLRRHMSTESHNHPCTVCDKQFTCFRYLRNHMDMMHAESPKQVVKCEVCGQTMRSIYYLRSHMLIHTKENPFKCKQCTSAFNRKDKLKRHMLLHDPVKKWKCPLRDVLGCDKEFSRPDKLKAHIISHGGVKGHKCSYCPKAYSRRCFKVAHERTHTDEFRCQRCKKGFENAKRLASHKCRPVTVEDPSSAKRKRTHRENKTLPKSILQRRRKKPIQSDGTKHPAETNAPESRLLARTGGVTIPLTLPEGPTMYAIRSGTSRKRSACTRKDAKIAFRKSIAAARRKERLRASAARDRPRGASIDGKINIEIEIQDEPSGDDITREDDDVTVVESDVDIEIEDADEPVRPDPDATITNL